MTETQDVPPGVDPTRPSTARMYDYFLGGTNNYPVDRQVAEKLRGNFPDLVDTMLANRGFHGRAAVWMAKHGIRQYIDLGSGLPTQNNTHESVRRVIPDARVVYVDIDPLVAAHSGTLLAGDGSTTVITADLRDPDALLSHPDLRRLIDFGEPAGVIATDVLHFLPDKADPWGLIRRYMAAVPPGSYLALSHGTSDKLPPKQVEDVKSTLARSAVEFHERRLTEIARFFDGLELVPPQEEGTEPAITYVGVWGAVDIHEADTDGSRAFYCGVARRPEGYTAA